MSILRFACNPADVGVGGYTWNTSKTSVFDKSRVEGAFDMNNGDAMLVTHGAPSGTEVWYHFRYAHGHNTSVNADGIVLNISDNNSDTVARLNWIDGHIRVEAVGDTTSWSGTQVLAKDAPYSMDIHVTVAASITVRWYINGALYGDRTVTNTGNKGVPRNVTFQNLDDNPLYYSEIIIADEDTRGMRVREMRPQSFGIFQEWDGSIASLRDSDLATGISTDTADRRVSFGVTNIENISPGDVINRVVAQTYAQKGETGLSQFNHFFRHANANVSDGADQTLSVLGDYFIEEFTTNPDTAVAWDPADFVSLQTGIRSRA